MKTAASAIVKTLLIGFAALIVVGASHGTARADVVNFQGSTAGCFNCSSGPFSTSASLLGLTYNNSAFNVTTTPAGNASIGNLPSAPNFNNLGSFTLSSDPATYDGNAFTLNVVFTSPAGADSPTFTATVTGQVITTSQGNLFIDFNNDFQTFSYANGGTFQFRLNDVSITPGGTVSLTGDIRSAANPVPEPTTMLLLGTGLAGVAAKLRQRKRAKKAAQADA